MTWYYSRRLILNVKKAVLCRILLEASLPSPNSSLWFKREIAFLVVAYLQSRLPPSEKSMCLAPKGLSP
jgi:hypothetical protein